MTKYEKLADLIKIPADAIKEYFDEGIIDILIELNRNLTVFRGINRELVGLRETQISLPIIFGFPNRFNVKPHVSFATV